MTYCLDLPHGLEIVGHWLYYWQTLIGGILAIVAALLGAALLRQQIQQAENHRKDDVLRRHNAVRCVVPLALASINAFYTLIAEHVATAIERRTTFDDAVDGFISGSPTTGRFPTVAVPEDAISTIRDFVETLTEPDDVRHVAELVSCIQILESRFNSFSLQQAAVIHGLFNLLIDTDKVSLLTEKMYNYGRFVDESSFSVVRVISHSEAWDNILGCAQKLILLRKSPDLFFSSLKERIDLYKAANTSPWNEKFPA